MIESKSFVKKSKKTINDDLRREFILASTDETFKKLCNRLKCDDEILMKYTSKLEDSCSELKNCSKCKGLDYCKNDTFDELINNIKLKRRLYEIHKGF